jgi:integrase
MNAAKQKSPERKREKLRLNARNANAQKLEDGEKEKFFWDDELTGFGLRLRREDEDSRVHRCWIAAYRVKGRYRRMTIGNYPKVSAEDARTAAKKIFGRVAHGEDPMAERQAQRLGAARSLRAVIDDYLAMKQATLRPASLRGTRLYLLGGYFRPLHASAITDITRADVAVRLNAIIKDSGPITARAARAALSAFFAWAWKQGIVEQNVVAGTEDPGPGESRERVLKDAELAAIWRACGDDDYGKIIRLLMLIPCRRQEIGGLRCNEIGKDEKGKPTITLPAERVKNKQTHTLPLLPLAQEIIDSIKPRAGRDSLFGDRSSAGFTRWSAGKADLDKQLKGKVADWRLHDLRRTVATKMGDLGVEPHVIEAAVNHQSGHKAGVAGIYNRSTYEKQIKTALAKWEDHLRSLIEGGRRKVLNFPQHESA